MPNPFTDLAYTQWLAYLLSTIVYLVVGIVITTSICVICTVITVGIVAIYHRKDLYIDIRDIKKSEKE